MCGPQHNKARRLTTTRKHNSQQFKLVLEIFAWGHDLDCGVGGASDDYFLMLDKHVSFFFSGGSLDFNQGARLWGWGVSVSL